MRWNRTIGGQGRRWTAFLALCGAVVASSSCRSAPERLLDDLNDRRNRIGPSREGAVPAKAGPELDESDARTLAVLDLLGDTAADRDRDPDPLVERARLLADRSDSPRATALLGAAILVAARDEFVFAQIAALDEGGGLLDRAVQAAPDDRLVRFLRAVATFPLPGIAGRRNQCRGDLARLFEDLGEPNALWTPDRQAFVCCMHASLCQERGETEAARAAYQRAVAIAPTSPSGRLASERLGTTVPGP